MEAHFTSIIRNGQAAKSLTPREIEVLCRLCEGLSNKEIARKLLIEEVTVRLHLRGIFRKLDASNRVHAVVKAHQVGLISPADNGRMRV